MKRKHLLSIHPGRIILEEFLAPGGISVFRLAKEIGVSPRRIYENRSGTAFDQRRHRPPPRTLLRHVRALLARSAGAVRWQARRETAERAFKKAVATICGVRIASRLRRDEK